MLVKFFLKGRGKIEILRYETSPSDAQDNRL